MKNDNSNFRIINQIFKSFGSHKKGIITANQLIANLNGNISGLENMPIELLGNFQCFAGEIEFVDFTEDEENIENIKSKLVKNILLSNNRL